MPYIPSFLKPFITEAKITSLIETELDAAKEYWSTNPAVITALKGASVNG